jgi:hypothetical protein
LSTYSLYREPVALDTVRHRFLRLAPATDHSMSAGMHASFVAVAEFAHAARDFVIVFVRDTVDGQTELQTVVLLGVTAGENLFVDGTRWDARYVPAYIRRYPFWTARIEGLQDPAVVIDAWWKGFSETEGDPLYEGDNQPAPRLTKALEFIRDFDVEAARTLEFCTRLDELALLRDMKADITLPGDTRLSLDGFLVVDVDALAALPDAQVLELHRNGMLGMIHAHLLSLGNLQALIERKARRLGAAAA